MFLATLNNCHNDSGIKYDIINVVIAKNYLTEEKLKILNNEEKQ